MLHIVTVHICLCAFFVVLVTGHTWEVEVFFAAFFILSRAFSQSSLWHWLLCASGVNLGSFFACEPHTGPEAGGVIRHFLPNWVSFFFLHMHCFLAGLSALTLFACMKLAGKGAGGCLNKKPCTYPEME